MDVARCRLCWILTFLGGCTSAAGPVADGGAWDGGGAGVDRDRDWLCDSTELRIGTDPHSVDSDGDRLPDGIETQFGFDPTDGLNPSPAQIVFLGAEPGAQRTHELHVVVEGEGESFAGELTAWPAVESTWATAEHYFGGAVAISAEPPDHVFGFPDNGDRIESIVGRTRLGYRLRFAYGDERALDCAQVVPFTYAIKRQDGARFGDRFYMLIVAPNENALSWCPALTCL